MAYLSTSPSLSTFPLSSSSRGTRQLPVPSSICTTLPPLSPPNHYTPRQQPLSTEQLFGSAHQFSGDSYFPHSHSNSSSIPSSTSSTPAPRTISPSPRRSTRAAKRTSISSLLSSPDNSSGNESSAASSPAYQGWSASSSPASTAGASRSNSVVNTPAINSTICYSPIDYNLPRRGSLYADHDEDAKLYSVATSSQRKPKGRSTPRAHPIPTNAPHNPDEYDVLGRKKPKTPRTPMSWDPKDDILLKQLKEEQRLGWKEIATHFRGRTSHACQFRWRRLASGQLKYYQGHRRPPPVTTTSQSFANEMAGTATAPMGGSPKLLLSTHNAYHHHHQSMSPTSSTPRQHHMLPIPSPTDSLPPLHPGLYHPHQQWSPQSMFQPTPLPSPTSYAPRFLGEDMGREWSEQEDTLLLNRKLSFDEVNVLLAQRTEQEIWERMVKLREPRMERSREGYEGMHGMGYAMAR